MEANETTGEKRRFWNRRMLFVASASTAAVVLLAGLLVWFSAPKNKLLTEMPTHQSRLWFLGPLRQPVSAVWQKFRATWIKPPQLVTYRSYQLNTTSPLPADLGAPILTNAAGVTVWILDAAMTESALKRPNLASFGGKATSPQDAWGPAFVQNHRSQCRLRSRPDHQTDFEVFVFGGIPPGQFAEQGTPTLLSTNHPSLKPFGARVTVPNGSAVLMLGPIPEFNQTNRFAGLFVPE